MDGRMIEDDAVVAQLADANFVEFAREQARWSGPLGSIVERDGVGMVASGSPFPVGANGVVRLDPTVPADEVLSPTTSASSTSTSRRWTSTRATWPSSCSTGSPATAAT